MPSTSEIETNNGAVQLEWTDTGSRYEAKLEGPDGERVVYSGVLPSAHVSGLRDGEYEVIVRAGDEHGWSGWSAPVKIAVEHHSIRSVVSLLAIGATTFVVTSIVLVVSARKDWA